MKRLVVRRRGGNPVSAAGTIVLGLALGAAAGWMVGEWLAPSAMRRIGVPRRAAARSMAELVRDAQGALAADPVLEAIPLEVRPVSRQRVELHGWVPSRRLRAHANRVAGEAVGAESVINCLLVRGEDDAADPDSPDALSA
jgi:hypothetical protein